MRLWIARLLIVTLTLVTGHVASSGLASACSLVAPFEVSPEQLASGELNAADSEIVVGYQQFWGDDQAPQILGGYVVETVLTLEPDGEWTRGSVSAVVEAWGQWPESVAPTLTETVNLSTSPSDSCGGPANGPELGARQVYLVTDLAGDEWKLSYEYDTEVEGTAALTAAFGDRDFIDRDREAEQLLLVQLNNARSGKATGIALAAGGIAIVGGVAIYQYLKRRSFA